MCTPCSVNFFWERLRHLPFRETINYWERATNAYTHIKIRHTDLCALSHVNVIHCLDWTFVRGSHHSNSMTKRLLRKISLCFELVDFFSIFVFLYGKPHWRQKSPTHPNRLLKADNSHSLMDTLVIRWDEWLDATLLRTVDWEHRGQTYTTAVSWKKLRTPDEKTLYIGVSDSTLTTVSPKQLEAPQTGVVFHIWSTILTRAPAVIYWSSSKSTAAVTLCLFMVAMKLRTGPCWYSFMTPEVIRTAANGVLPTCVWQNLASSHFSEGLKVTIRTRTQRHFYSSNVSIGVSTSVCIPTG